MESRNTLGRMADHHESSMQPRQSAYSRPWLWLTVCMSAIVYSMFPTRHFYWDGVKFALRIDTFPTLPGYWTDPNHLLYAWVGGCFKKALLTLGLDVPSIYVLQIFDIACGLAGIALFNALALRLQLSTLSRNIGLFVFAFSAIWWNYSIDISSYIITVDLMMYAALVLYNRPRFWRVKLTLSLALATIFHQLAALFSVVVVLYAVVEKKWLRSNVAVVGSAGLISLSIQYAAYLTNPINWKALPPGVVSADADHVLKQLSFIDWLLTHSSDSGFTFRVSRSLAGLATGTIKMFFGGKISDIIFVPDIVIAAAIIIAIIIIFFALCRTNSIAEGLGERESGTIVDSSSRVLISSLLSWVIIYIVFQFFWMPLNSFYRILYLPPFLLMVLYIFDRYIMNYIKVVIICVVLMILWNFLFYIYPRSRVAHNDPLMAALRLAEKVETGERIYYKNFDTDNWVIRYFNFETKWFVLSDIRDIYPNETVWVDPSAWEWLSSSRTTASCVRLLGEMRSKSDRREIVFRKITVFDQCRENANGSTDR